LLYLNRGFRSIGPIVLIFEKVCRVDLMSIYIIFVIGFSQGNLIFYLIL